MSVESASPPTSPGGAFPSTQWSMVLHAGVGVDTQARAALESLCRQYWYPLYSFVRRQGRAHHEAEDCTQEFLSRLLASHGVARAQPERGRFRTFLLTALRNFLTNEWHRAQTVRRGGGQAPLPLEVAAAEQRFAREPTDPALTPEHVFDHNWAREMLEHAVADLRTEYAGSGRTEVFTALEPLLWHHATPEARAELAGRLGLNANAFNVALQRLRRRLGERLRLAVAQTVATEAEVDAELRHLLAAVSGNTSAT